MKPTVTNVHSLPAANGLLNNCFQMVFIMFLVFISFNIGTSLLPCCACFFLQLFLVVWIFPRSVGVFCYDRWVLNEGHKNLLQGLLSHELTAYLSVSNQFLTQWIMTILSKRCKPDNFESHNPLKLRFTDIWGLHLNFIEREFFLESNSPDIHALCVTNLDD